MKDRIATFFGYVREEKLVEARKQLGKMQSIAERRLKACKSLEKQKATQYARINKLEEEASAAYLKELDNEQALQQAMDRG